MVYKVELQYQDHGIHQVMYGKKLSYINNNDYNINKNNITGNNITLGQSIRNTPKQGLITLSRFVPNVLPCENQGTYFQQFQ